MTFTFKEVKHKLIYILSWYICLSTFQTNGDPRKGLRRAVSAAVLLGPTPFKTRACHLRRERRPGLQQAVRDVELKRPDRPQEEQEAWFGFRWTPVQQFSSAVQTLVQNTEPQTKKGPRFVLLLRIGLAACYWEGKQSKAVGWSVRPVTMVRYNRVLGEQRLWTLFTESLLLSVSEQRTTVIGRGIFGKTQRFLFRSCFCCSPEENLCVGFVTIKLSTWNEIL